MRNALSLDLQMPPNLVLAIIPVVTGAFPLAKIVTYHVCKLTAADDLPHGYSMHLMARQYWCRTLKSHSFAHSWPPSSSDNCCLI
ncbi:hypothetical protein FRC12_002644 [Ceratobasidium sp. 428]|nr:hypothetical protein FRC12_002644 [Ceratobasidium sp. 428]